MMPKSRSLSGMPPALPTGDRFVGRVRQIKVGGEDE
jgi:hypothetical protein